MHYKLVAFATVLVFLFPNATEAQTHVTFRVDMSAMMEDSIFVPDRGSVRIKGNKIPFSNIHTVLMADKPPVDSVYVADMRFPSLVNGEILKYKFIIRMPYKTIKERRYRLLRLKGQEVKLPTIYFNAFIH